MSYALAHIADTNDPHKTLPPQAGHAGAGLVTDGVSASWSAGAAGTVTGVSVVSANGFAGSVANPTTTPAITLTTTLTGLLKGNGTAMSAAVAGTDYALPSQTFFLGTTSIAINRASAAIALAGITSIDGSAAKWTTARNLAGNSVDGSANVAFANKFIVQGTADTGLSAAQFLGALGTGIIKNTTTTGVMSIAVAADFPTLNQNTTGSAATLTTARTINGTSFDGSANITVTAAAGTLTGATLNSTVTASSLTTVGTLTALAFSSGSSTGATFTTASSTSSITITDTGTSGANLKFVGNGATTPNKYIRVQAGAMEWGNSAYSQIVMTLTDAGNLTAVGSMLSSNATGGIGYATGAGGTITQLTSKSQGVTLNKVCGAITMHNASLAANTRVQFVFTNSAIAAGDTVVIHRVSGGTGNAYLVNIDSTSAGSCVVTVWNYAGGALAEAIVLGFAVVKVVTA